MPVADFDAEQFYLARVARNRTQSAVAKEVGLTQGTISAYESGSKRPADLLIVIDLAKAVGIPVSVLSRAAAEVKRRMNHVWDSSFCWLDATETDALHKRMRDAKRLFTVHANTDSCLEPSEIQYNYEKQALVDAQAQQSEIEAFDEWVQKTTHQKLLDRQHSNTRHTVVSLQSHFLQNYEQNSAYLDTTVQRLKTSLNGQIDLSIIPSSWQGKPVEQNVTAQVSQLIGRDQWLSLCLVDDDTIVYRPESAHFEVTRDPEEVQRIHGGLLRILREQTPLETFDFCKNERATTDLLQNMQRIWETRAQNRDAEPPPTD